jgi:hypothetical protein
MDILLVENILLGTNFILEILSITFITFVFFDLVFIDRSVQLSELSEKYEKFKRYDIFKSSLIFLVLSLYFGFFAKIAVYFEFPSLSFSVFTFVGNIFLLLFVYKLYKLLHNYVPDIEGKAQGKSVKK